VPEDAITRELTKTKKSEAENLVSAVKIDGKYYLAYKRVGAWFIQITRKVSVEYDPIPEKRTEYNPRTRKTEVMYLGGKGHGRIERIPRSKLHELPFEPKK